MTISARSVLVVTSVFLVGGCAPAPTRAEVASVTVAALGETLRVDSKILAEQRVINIYVPPGYATSKERYPVLYMPDGGMNEDFPHIVGAVDVSTKNGLIRPVIVVGIQNTVRRRDLAPATAVPDEQKAAPLAGGTDRFRAFLRDELKPLIAARFRTTTESAIVGESLAGLFALETLIVEPTLFDSYIAADPAMYWNEQRAVRLASEKFAWWTAGPKQLYVATGDLPEMQDSVATLITALRTQKPPITWTYEPMPTEGHGTIFPTAALHGIRLVFAAPPES
jgi:uncharacterized protein